MKPGDKVTMTEEALNARLQGRDNRRTGEVVELLETPLIRVKRDGMKRAETWSQYFWKVIKNEN